MKQENKEPISESREKTLTEYWGIKKEPVSESVEEAANRLGYNNDEIQPYFKEGFIACADWMKGNNEQMLNEKFDIGFTAGSNATAERFQSMLLEDKELIRELLNLIGDEQHPTITKATQYLNQ